MQRLLSTTVLVGLLIATAAAFAVTERLKLEKSPITGTQVSPVFSPLCACAHAQATVSVRLRRADSVTVAVLDSRERRVRLLVDGARLARGTNVFRWDGRTEAGRRARDGTYFVEIHLSGQHRTILLPNRIQLDTLPPEVRNVALDHGTFSPDGDHQSDAVRIRYELSKGARAVVFLRGRQILKTYRHPATGEVAWNGIAHQRRLPPGTYALELGAIDPAGNATPAAKRWGFRVTIRYIALANRRISGVKAGARFDIGVSTDARRYRWRLGSRKGVASGPVLKLRAPTTPGRYTLTVSERGHADRAAVIVG